MGNNERRYDIDWLRALAMLMIFLFHGADCQPAAGRHRYEKFWRLESVYISVFLHNRLSGRIKRTIHGALKSIEILRCCWVYL